MNKITKISIPILFVYLFLFSTSVLAQSPYDPQIGNDGEIFGIISTLGFDSIQEFISFLEIAGMTAFALYLKKVFLRDEMPSEQEYLAALNDYALLSYGKNLRNLELSERISLKKDFLKIFGGYPIFSDEEYNYLRDSYMPSALPSLEEEARSIGTGVIVGAAAGAIFGGVGAVPGAIAGLVAGAAFPIIQHGTSWLLMKARRMGLDMQDNLIIENGDESITSENQHHFIKPSDSLYFRDEDMRDHRPIADFIGSIIGVVGSILISLRVDKALGVAGSADEIINSGDEVVGAVDDTKNIRYTNHATEQMAVRGVTSETAENILRTGQRLIDTKTGSLVAYNPETKTAVIYVIENGYTKVVTVLGPGWADKFIIAGRWVIV